MARNFIFDKLLDSFKGKPVVFTDTEANYKERVFYTMSVMLENLSWTDKKIFEAVKEKFDVSFSQCFNDINVAERIIGTDKNPNVDPHKTWARYFISQIAKESIAIAREKKDNHGMAIAAATYGKYNMADKEDLETPQWDKVLNPLTEFTSDPTVLPNYKPIPKELRQRMEKQFGIYSKTENAVIVENNGE